MSDEEVRALLEGCARGEISAPLAAMTLLLRAAAAPDPVEAALAALARAAPGGANDAVAGLLRAHGGAAAPLAALARAAPAAPEACARFFDEAAAVSEEAAVALYTLGDPALLARATAEIRAVLAGWGVLGHDRAALDLGCGIGRVAAALAPDLGSIDGVDVSPRMLAAARRRCAALPQLRFHLGSAADLAIFAPARFDLVLAVDTLPYLHAGGQVDACLRAVARVLRPGGDVAIFNLSYRGDPAADRADVAAAARALGLAVRVDGASPFTLWDGLAFLLHAPGAGPSATPD
jgi:SAM-dependent methyltransferase